MRWGLIARGEDRGLGNLTWEVARNLGPDRTLLVEMGPLAKGFPSHPERFPDSMRVPFTDGRLSEDDVRRWLDGLDVVLTAETFYDWRVIEWAADAGSASVVYAMPEFCLHAGGNAAGIRTPTRFWNPTCWRQDVMPPGTKVVPLPVATDRFAPRIERDDGGPLRVLHVAGHRATHDRNGTSLVLVAARKLRADVVLTITGQDGRLPTLRGVPRNVQVVYEPHSADDYWSLYEGHDVLLMPRRFGGLCMPVQEALAAGLAVVMPDCAPNPQTWPIIPLRARPQGTIRTGGGDVPLWTSNPTEIARVIDGLASDRDRLAIQQDVSLTWAELYSWDRLRGDWLAELASAALAGRRAARA